ncbi:response regulator transcription factor [Fulvivirga sedimenti]|uniref:Phosphate regulon transcriptional regulatory protein PhoB n=1 Tax=Fulvivirga sedimenti TaxID=2879465 RepID=A0A9X1HWX2_9BACT|nr:response regulator transcription factor [Fulvivirga sedimenti]MCA6078563.1 response regulator transcription factor [Fulvivirga sedimenti]
MKNVLLIEDDMHIKDLLEMHLRDMGCTLEMATNGRTGYELALNQPFDLLVLDVMLPEKDGIEICRDLRAREIKTPILMLTARSEEVDKIIGLETGADDYLTKPFSIREFLARVKAIFRRMELNKADDRPLRLLQFEMLEIDQEKRKVSLNGQRVDLTPKEFDLLSLLAEHPGTSYSRDRLLRLIWGYEFEGYEHTVNSHINRLRAKIEPDLSNPKYILTSWGVGYRFNDEL